ncbi:hypothetical protein BGZ61DRAFT_82267 [Ilyonectria robusta]|uniref:uncharacterized protein n=1 Tax=Ilyonectria robusta TaxID=1079257 RepID=UPI001E8EE66A|nr:uncharacterized protein BGZ61DRAFT_82267 [Ilyonectria robusta]KAH8735621.1 hypothetical protein BGZ61DRAFT_82267 [Ilyonectria robusta]
MSDRDSIHPSGLSHLDGELKLNLDHIPLTEEEIHADLERVRKTLASVDQPTLTTVKNRSRSEGAQTWAQGTIRDITSKCNEVKEASASTPITTTTGYDLPMSTSSQNSPTGYRRRRNLSRVIYNLPDLSSMTDSSGSSQTNPTPNTSLNSEPPVETPATDVTSVRHLGLTIQRSAMLASKGLGDRKLETAESHLQCSMSPMSMYTTHQEEICETEKIGLTHRRHNIPSTMPKETNEIQNPMSEMRTEATDPPVYIPGSYPDHPHADVDADIADPSSNECHDGGGAFESGGLWDATKEVLGTTKSYVVLFITVCWQMVSPVFDYRSEWWERNARQETTYWDCVCVALAVPVTVLIVSGVLWAIRLAATAGACVRQGLVIAGEELVVAFGG